MLLDRRTTHRVQHCSERTSRHATRSASITAVLCGEIIYQLISGCRVGAVVMHLRIIEIHIRFAQTTNGTSDLFCDQGLDVLRLFLNQCQQLYSTVQLGGMDLSHFPTADDRVAH